MSENSVTGKAFDLKLFRRILTYVQPYRARFVFSVSVTIILALMSVGRPLVVLVALNNLTGQDSPVMHSFIFDNAFFKGSGPDFLLRMTITMMVLLFTEAVLQFLNGYYTSWLGQSIIKDMRVQLFKHIGKLRPKYFDNTPIGMLVTRVISDIEAIADIFSQGFIVIMGDIMTLVVYVVWMFVIDWKLSLAVMATVPLLLFATYIFKNSVKSAFQDVRTQVARLNTFVQEHITGMKIVQIFNREEREFEKFKEINAKHRDANIRSVLSYSIFFPVVEILLSVSIGLLVWQGGKEMFRGEIQPGEITFFIMLTNMFFRPIRMLADRVNTLQMGMVASERVFRVLDTKEYTPDNGSAVLENLKREIVFENVWFAYNDENWVLRDVSFTVKKGETIALVGSTGSGKSSVINLLNRFYEYNMGKILIDGKDVREYKLDSLRKSMVTVLQDVFLFSDTIANNISLMDPSITRERIVEAAKAIGAHDFIMKLPGGYDYNVMERGAMLSVGQRQLISFIRAYVFDPKIFVLDEATSSIDTESEILIQQASEKLAEGRTSIVIAHRLATIQKADRIIVLDHGQILEQGTHQELLRMNGQYKRLFELQFKNEEVV
ncbi:MAG TPA: ABC transporter ATP-binding protein [Bacteroidia bacterium]|jgi:ATP-binding cassette subfamily B protein